MELHLVTEENFDDLVEQSNGVMDMNDDGSKFIHWPGIFGFGGLPRAYVGDEIWLHPGSPPQVRHISPIRKAPKTSVEVDPERVVDAAAMVKGLFPGLEENIRESLKSEPKEVRTTSSTGGQKGVKLERFDLIPIGPLTELARHYGRGAKKYADHQWRQGYEWGKSYSAILRHLTAFWGGEDYDICPSFTHAATDEQKAAAGCAFNETFPDVDGHTTCLNHTGSHHMAAVAWHSFLLLEFYEKFPEHDDRFKPSASQ